MFRRRARLVGVAWAAAAAVVSCAPDAPLAPDAGVLRLGAPAGYARIGGISRPLLRLDAPGRSRLSLRGLPPGRLLLAAGLAAEGEAASSAATCAARLEGAEGPTPLASLAPSGPHWADAEVALPAIERGALVLECDTAQGSPVWARPLLLPLDPPTPQPLVVLLSLDTLRADHVSGFGAAANPTPQLETLGREGLRLTGAVAEGTWTLASHYALLYSRIYGFPLSVRPLVSLADALGEAGFASVAFTGGGFMGAAFHYHRGFDRFAEYPTGEDDLAGVLSEAGAWIDRLAPAPSFVFVHTYAVHESPPEEVRWHEARGAFATFRPSPAQVEAAHAFYRGVVERADAALGGFFARLHTLARERPVLLVVVSDHGEAFGEHRNFRHGYGDASVTLHDEVVRVPFIVWGPGLVPPGRSADVPVGLSDVAPSLLRAVGRTPPPGMVGADLWPLWSGTGPAPQRDGAVTHTQGAWSLRSASRKLIVHHVAGRAERFELYDLGADPGEQRDLAGSRPDAVADLARRLRRRLLELGVPAPEVGRDYPVCPLCTLPEASAFWAQALEEAGSRELDADTRRRLHDLGYLD